MQPCPQNKNGARVTSVQCVTDKPWLTPTLYESPATLTVTCTLLYRWTGPPLYVTIWTTVCQSPTVMSAHFGHNECGRENTKVTDLTTFCLIVWHTKLLHHLWHIAGCTVYGTYSNNQLGVIRLARPSNACCWINVHGPKWHGKIQWKYTENQICGSSKNKQGYI